MQPIKALVNRRLHLLYEYFALSFGLGMLGLLCLGWSPVAWLLCRVQSRQGEGRGRGRLGRFGRFVNMAVFRFYLWTLSATRAMRFDIAALDVLAGDEPVIIAPNHPCLLDALLVISRLPNVVCIMKNALTGNFFLGHGARLARYIGNDSLMAMIRESVQTLAEGNHLLLFPEGTRTVREPVNKFTAAVGLIAARGRVPVQTVFIECDSRFLSKGWPLFRRPSLPIRYHVRLGKRFDPPEDVRAFTHELERYFDDELTRSAPVTVMPGTPAKAARLPARGSANLANPT